MKILYLSIAVASMFPASAQQKKLPEPLRQMPGKDGVMVLDRLAAGGSKQYNIHSATAKLQLEKGDGPAGCIEVRLNDKIMLRHYMLSNRTRTITIPLTKKVNILTIAAATGSKQDHFNANATLTAPNMTYNVVIACNKTTRDSIIINKR